jgi:REP element-mobilizing transposase RayT
MLTAGLARLQSSKLNESLSRIEVRLGGMPSRRSRVGMVLRKTAQHAFRETARISDFLHRQKFKTCKRYNVLGDAHGLTFNCFQARAFLSRQRSCAWMISALSDARASLRFDIWAYVIMPEHCHVLIFPRLPKYDISLILSAIKIPVTRRAKAFLQKNAPDALALMRDEQPNPSYAAKLRKPGFSSVDVT